MNQHQCEICLPVIKIYKKRDGLTEHIRLKHGNRSVVRCDSCNIEFVNNQSYNTHRNKYHPEHRVEYPCDVEGCDFVFDTKSGFDSHKKTHEEPKFCCDQCSNKYYHKTSLTKHKKTH